MSKTKAQNMADVWAYNLIESASDDEWFHIYENAKPVDRLAYGFFAGFLACIAEAEKMAIKPHVNSVTQFEPFVNLCDLKKLLEEG